MKFQCARIIRALPCLHLFFLFFAPLPGGGRHLHLIHRHLDGGPLSQHPFTVPVCRRQRQRQGGGPRRLSSLFQEPIVNGNFNVDKCGRFEANSVLWPF